MGTDNEEMNVLNIRGWRVRGVQVSRGFGARVGSSELPENLIGLTLQCEDLAHPGYFVMSVDEAEVTARALLDSVERARRGESL